jgi:hypothetical protein
MSAFEINKVNFTGVIDDISTAGQIYIPVPKEMDGDVYEVVATLNNAITVADAVLTVKDGGGNTIGTLTVAFTGSAAGSTFTADMKGAVRPGTAIEIETDGGSTTAAKCYVSVVVRR